MGQPLTWRNVEAPDFRGSLAGLQVAGQSFDRAFTGMSDSLGKFRDYQKEAAASAVLNNAMGFSDPAELRQAIADGRVFQGADRTLLSPQALAALNATAGTLLTQAGQQQELSFNNEMNPIRISDARRALDFNTRADPLRIEGMRLNNAQSDLSVRRGNWNFGNEQTDRAASDLGNAAATEALRRAGSGPGGVDDAIRYLNSQNLPPAAMRIAMAAVDGQFRNAFGDPSGAPAGGTAGGGAGRAGGAGAPGAGGAAPGSMPRLTGNTFIDRIPLRETANYVTNILSNAGSLQGLSREQVIERLLPLVIQRESSGRHRNPDGTLLTSSAGAQGVTQVMPDTGTRPGFGVRPLQNDSREEYVRFGRDYLTALLNNYGGNVEQALAAYNAGPGRVDGWLRDSAANVQEDLRARGAQAASAIQAATARVLQDNAQGIIGRLPELQANNSMSMNDAIAQLRGGAAEGSGRNQTTAGVARFGDAGVDQLEGALRDIMQRGQGRINIATATALLDRYGSLQSRSWIGRNTVGLVSRPGIDLDEDGLNSAISGILDGTAYSQARGSQALLATANNVQQAQARLEAIGTDLEQARATADARGAPVDLSERQRQYRLAQEALDRALAQHTSNLERAPVFTRPLGAQRAQAPGQAQSAAPAERTASQIAAAARASGPAPEVRSQASAAASSTPNTVAEAQARLQQLQALRREEIASGRRMSGDPTLNEAIQRAQQELARLTAASRLESAAR